MVCCCALAGTAACKNCRNNPNYSSDTTYTYEYIFSSAPDIEEKSKKIKPIITHWCPECEAKVEKFMNFCHNCGTELDWSEYE